MTAAEYQAELNRTLAQRDYAEAQLQSALSKLSDLVRYVKRVGGYMAMPDQITLREAEAVLVENGRSVER